MKKKLIIASTVLVVIAGIAVWFYSKFAKKCLGDFFGDLELNDLDDIELNDTELGEIDITESTPNTNLGDS